MVLKPISGDQEMRIRVRPHGGTGAYLFLTWFDADFAYLKYAADVFNYTEGQIEGFFTFEGISESRNGSKCLFRIFPINDLEAVENMLTERGSSGKLKALSEIVETLEINYDISGEINRGIAFISESSVQPFKLT